MSLFVFTDKKEEYLTPPEILRNLGEFDLDPCSPIDRPWDTAKKHFNKQHDGLLLDWEGRVWLNPPYGSSTGTWLKRLVEHGDGVALIFARTDTKMFFDFVWDKADAVLFMEGRVFFYSPKGERHKNSGGAPSCLIAYGSGNAEILRESKVPGKFVMLNK